MKIIFDPLKMIMGVEEAAKRWGLSPGYIKNLCNEGKVKAKKIGNSWILVKEQPNPGTIDFQIEEESQLSKVLKRISTLPKGTIFEVTDVVSASYWDTLGHGQRQQFGKQFYREVTQDGKWPDVKFKGKRSDNHAEYEKI